jgi:hypothetical protein
MTWISWMIVELANDKRHQTSLKERVKSVQTIECSCLSQLHIICRQAVLGRDEERDRDIRFPWIQRSEPFDFHSLYMLP